MENLVFVIPHHSTTSEHTLLLIRCLKSIRCIYKINKILVCKTSTSVIEDAIKQEFNIIIENTIHDGSHVYGAICSIISNKFEKFILLHDSMVLLKNLPLNILNLNIFYLWHFDGVKDDHSNSIMSHLNAANIDTKLVNSLVEKFESYSGWKGCFGPAFGGNYESLYKIYDFLKLTDTIKDYVGRSELMCAERFISVIAEFMGLVSIESLNGSIFKQPLAFADSKHLDIQNIKKLNYNGYFFKSWVARNWLHVLFLKACFWLNFFLKSFGAGGRG